MNNEYIPFGYHTEHYEEALKSIQELALELQKEQKEKS